MPGSPHMTPEEFRRRGHEVVEWVAAYMERVGELPIAPAVEPGEIRAKLPAAETLERLTFRFVGAGFVVLLAGDIMTMPGLPREPAASSIDLADDGTILGLA